MVFLIDFIYARIISNICEGHIRKNESQRSAINYFSFNNNVSCTKTGLLKAEHSF